MDAFESLSAQSMINIKSTCSFTINVTNVAVAVADDFYRRNCNHWPPSINMVVSPSSLEVHVDHYINRSKKPRVSSVLLQQHLSAPTFNTGNFHTTHMFGKNLHGKKSAGCGSLVSINLKPLKSRKMSGCLTKMAKTLQSYYVFSGWKKCLEKKINK